ncbi:MAG: hypothetical protein RLZZ480_641 [Candidatus Parcubacteria bacterium]|jgi:hypothetical protein
MNFELNNVENTEVIKEKHPVFRVTKTSKYLAMLLFITMPFLGGWIGYTYAPEKIVTETPVVNDLKVQPKEVQTDTLSSTSSSSTIGYTGYIALSPIESAREHLLKPAQTSIPDFNLDEDSSPRDMLYPDGGGGKMISLEEVSTHDVRSDCWVVYKNGAHDISSLFELSDILPAIEDLNEKCGTDIDSYIENLPVAAGSLNTARFAYAMSGFWTGYWVR